MIRGRFDGTTLRWPEDPLLAPGASFELVEEKVLGAPVAVFRERPHSFAEVLEATHRFADREAFVFDDRRIAFDEFRSCVASVAHAMREDWKIGPGDRVALLGGNSAEWILAFSAVAASGGVVVALNGWWTAPEIEYALELTRPRLLLSDRRRAQRLEGRKSSISLVILEDVLPEWETRAPEVSPPDVDIDEDDPAVMLFTSGTTGRPKGAVNTHRNLAILATSTAHAGARAAAPPGAAGPPAFEPCSLCCLPLFHVSGLQGGLLHTLMLGNRSVWPGGRFDPERVLQLTERFRITTWSFVPTQLWRVLEHPRFGDYDLASVSFAGGGGAAWAPELTRLLRERLPRAAANMSFGFGQTECAGMGTVNAAPFALEDPTSVGVPRPGVEVAVRDEAGRFLPEGCEGEILLRGACVMAEYWEDPAANAATLLEDRWLCTGDIGCIRGGRLYLTSRRSDLILRGGENVYPIEIEHRLVEHPEVADAAVFGVEHRVLGQEVKAVVQLREAGSLTPEAVRAWVAEALAPYKVPSHVELSTEALPRNASGKVMKHVLRGDAENQFIEE
jgi:acyl-CoA synthetase (AMP-forming)/AMP-acid ligase II